jgi:hypothetical protein
MHIVATAALVAAGVATPAVLAGSGSAASSGASSRNHTPALWFRHAGLTERATLGSYCVSTVQPDGTSTGGCGDAAYPLRTHGRLPVRPGGRVVVRTSVVARHLQATLLQAGSSSSNPNGGRLHARRLSARRWAVRIPAVVPSGGVLDVSLRWHDARDGQGDADFWGGMRVGSCG